ncbi:U2 small nuclear ribonucleoprotein A' [Camellia lanceoleosa]|uniref:U2 small nuclear ribonucleoprotein A n=1 Tax=Camellia lanceoleosa TaxID=1840588 RepID=A0ACC0IUX2_9ERIC|nr:U2 small nuclear ribonucleoprotein A' [Camellia lanceoleosa]
MNLEGFIKREKGSKGAHLSELSHEEGLPEFLPKLHTLVLTNNQLTNLVEIDPLASLPKLQFLSLLDNNITEKPNYRLYVIHKLKSLRLLDCQRLPCCWMGSELSLLVAAKWSKDHDMAAGSILH